LALVSPFKKVRPLLLFLATCRLTLFIFPHLREKEQAPFSPCADQAALTTRHLTKEESGTTADVVVRVRPVIVQVQRSQSSIRAIVPVVTA